MEQAPLGGAYVAIAARVLGEDAFMRSNKNVLNSHASRFVRTLVANTWARWRAKIKREHRALQKEQARVDKARAGRIESSCALRDRTDHGHQQRSRIQFIRHSSSPWSSLRRCPLWRVGCASGPTVLRLSSTWKCKTSSQACGMCSGGSTRNSREVRIIPFG